MSIGNRQELRTAAKLRLDPRIVLNSAILQLAGSELELAIETELAENPALERLDGESEAVTREAILRTVAPHELRVTAYDYESQRSLPSDGADDTDWTDLAGTSDSLWDHLRAQLLSALPTGLRDVGEYVVGCINEKGYFTSEIEEVALDCGCSLETAELVLNLLQRCEPPGVGAMNLRECLLLQLRNARTVEEKLARMILKSHFQEFLQQNVRPISKRYRVHPDLVLAAFEQITALTPFPGEAFACSAIRLAASASVPALADLAFTRMEAGWRIDVSGPVPGSLFVSRSYRDRLAEIERKRRAAQDEKRHLNEYMDRADRFIGALEQRRRTMLAIGQFLLDNQLGFISTGEYRFLGPLTRFQLAQGIGLHESTVSRATQGKFAQIGNGEVVAFDIFFKPALRVQKMIEEILATENPKDPLSDERIAQILELRGISVARRTVNKYRDRTKLLSSRRRRSA